MADPIAGSSVRITPDLSTFADDLKAKLDEATADSSQSVSITPDLDESVLKSDLDQLKTQVEASGSTIHFTANLDDEAAMQTAADLKAAFDTIAAEKITATVGIDDDAGKAELDDFDRELDGFGLKRVAATVNVDTGDDELKLAALGASLDGLGVKLDFLSGNLQTFGADLGGAGQAAEQASGGLSGLMTTAVALGPAIVPVGAAVVGAFAALLPMLLSAGAGVGAFALAASGDLKGLEDDVKGTLAEFQKLEEPVVEPAIGAALKLVIPIFADLVPLVDSTATELDKLADSAKSALEGSFWQGFVTFLASEAGPAIGAFSALAGGLATAFAGISEAMGPIITDIEGDLTSLGAGLANFGANAGSNSFQTFLSYIETEGPVVGQLLSNLGGNLTGLVGAAAPLGAVILQVVTSLSGFLNDILSLGGPLDTVALGIAGLVAVYVKLDGPIGNAIQSLDKFRLATLAVNDAGEASAGGIAGLVGSMGGLGSVLGTALPVIGLVGLAMWAFKSSADAAQASSTAWLNGITTESATTLPQLSAKLDDLSTKYRQLGNEIAVYNAADVGPPMSVQDSYNTLGTAIAATTAQIKTYKENLSEVGNQTGLTNAQVVTLASSINIDLTKALDPAQVRQFTAALQEQAAQAGLTSDQVKAMAEADGTSFAAIIKAGNTAAAAATTAWQSYGNAVTNFASATLPPTAAAISQFYTQQETQGAQFSENIQTAIKAGYSPSLISSILQAGPAQASQLLQGLVNAQGTGLNNLITQAMTAMSAEGAQAVEEARVTAEAVASKSSTMAAQLSQALALDQALTTSSAVQAVQTVAGKYSDGVAGVLAVAKEYGIALPNSIQAEITSAQQTAAAQAAGVSSALGAGVPNISNLASSIAASVPNAITAAQPATATATQLTADQFIAILHAHLPAAQDAGTGLATSVKTGVEGVNLSPSGTAALTQIVSALTENGGFLTPKGAASSLVASISAKLGGLSGALAPDGTALIQGMAAGMTSAGAQAAVAWAAQSAVASAKAAVAKFAGIASPSKLFADEIGLPLTQGIAAGMVSPSALGALSTAANTVVGHALNAAAGGQGALKLGVQVGSNLGGLPSGSTSGGMGQFSPSVTVVIQGNADASTVNQMEQVATKVLKKHVDEFMAEFAAR